VYEYTCEGTIEERIDQILKGKQLLFDEIVDDVSIDLKAHLSAEELFGLFGLTPPASVRTSANRSSTLGDYTKMSGTEFEQYVKGLLERQGWTVETTPVTRDGGIDLIANRIVDIGGEVALYIQCKNYASPVGVEVVRQLNGALPKSQPGSRGVVVCPSGFTADARSFAKDRSILLWDRQHLFELDK
jgi:HJR/Mrr/RecB family endonuclease